MVFTRLPFTVTGRARGPAFCARAASSRPQPQNAMPETAAAPDAAAPFSKSRRVVIPSSLSLALDVRGLDDGPPFVGLGLLQRAQPLWRLLRRVCDLHAQLLAALPHGAVGKCLEDGGSEVGDDLGAGALGNR